MRSKKKYPGWSGSENTSGISTTQTIQIRWVFGCVKKKKKYFLVGQKKKVIFHKKSSPSTHILHHTSKVPGNQLPMSRRIWWYIWFDIKVNGCKNRFLPSQFTPIWRGTQNFILNIKIIRCWYFLKNSTDLDSTRWVLSKYALKYLLEIKIDLLRAIWNHQYLYNYRNRKTVKKRS